MSAEINLEKKFVELFPRQAHSMLRQGERSHLYETFLSIFEAGFREGMEAEATNNKEANKS